MLKQLDHKTKYMMYEADERTTSVEDLEKRIANMDIRSSIILIAEEDKNIVGFLSANRGFARRIKQRTNIILF